MNRRSVLRRSALSVPVLLSGCSMLQSSDPSTVKVSQIEIRNRLDRDIDVRVLLTNDGEATYLQDVTVPASTNPFATLDDLPESPGVYELYAHIPSVENDPPVNADLVEAAGDKGCITVQMEVTTETVDGESLPAVAYGSIGECTDSG